MVNNQAFFLVFFLYSVGYKPVLFTKENYKLSLHRDFGLPTPCILSGLPSLTTFTILSSSVLSTPLFRSRQSELHQFDRLVALSLNITFSIPWSFICDSSQDMYLWFLHLILFQLLLCIETLIPSSTMKWLRQPAILFAFVICSFGSWSDMNESNITNTWTK